MFLVPGKRKIRISFLFPAMLSLTTLSCGKVASVSDGDPLPAGLAALVVTKLTIEPVQVGKPYSQTISVAGGQAPYKFAITHGSLPEGLQLNAASGEISGTVPHKAAGSSSNFTIAVEDNLGLQSENQYELDVLTYHFGIYPESLPLVAPGFQFNFGFSAPEALPPVLWTFSGKLPPGLELDNATGVLKSDTAGISPEYQKTEWAFRIIALDANGIESSASYKLRLAATIPIAPIEIDSDSVFDGIAGSPYATRISVTGGVAPYKFELNSGSLIDGLALDSGTGVISGTIPRSQIEKSVSFEVKVTGSSGLEALYPFSMTVLPYSFALVPEELPAVSPVQPYSFKLSSVGATAPVTYSVSGALPTGLSLDAATGRFQDVNGGVPTNLENTTHNFTIIAEDANAVRVSRAFTLQVGPASVIPQLQIVTNSLGTASNPGQPFAGVIAVSGGTSPYTFTSPNLPAWLSVNPATGELSGTVPYYATTQAHVFQIQVTDAQAVSVTKTYALTVDPYVLTLSPANPVLPAAEPGASYQTALTASGREAAFSSYTFSLQSGTLPAGLTLSSSGVISGVIDESEAGLARNFTVSVTDGVVSTPRTYTINTNNFPVAVSAVLASATENASYSAAISASYTSPVSACAGCTFEITGSLPAGLVLAADGSLTGTPAGGTGAIAGQNYAVTVRARDPAGKVSRPTAVSLTVNVSAPVLSVDPTPPDAVFERPYSWRGIAANGGRIPYSYSLVSGALPPGLTLNAATGEVSGTASTPVTCPGNEFGLRATDALGQQTAVETRCIPVNSVTIDTAALPDAIEDASYSFQISASGGAAPYTWEFIPGPHNLPAGLVLESGGRISGTPAAFTGSVAGTPYTFSVRAVDSQGVPGPSKALTLRVTLSVPQLVAVVPANGMIGSSYTHQLSASGGRPPYSYSLGGSLPAGLSLTSGTGAINGLPSASSACPANQFTIVVIDSLAQTSAGTAVCITISDGMKFNENAIPTIVRSSFYSTTLTIDGGVPPYTFFALNLPSGLTMNAGTGEISGFTTIPAGIYTPQITVTDNQGNETSSHFSVNVADALTFGAITLPSGGAGLGYGPVTIAATGGVPPYAFLIESGALPSGLTLSGNQISGTISGDAAATPTYNFTLRVSDSAGLSTVSGMQQIDVFLPPIIRTKRLRPALDGSPFAFTMQRRGGTPPFSWTAQNLPAGLNINAATGVISGSASGTGSFNSIIVTVEDSNGLADQKTFSMDVVSAGKKLDIHAARFSEPCPQTPNYNCAPRAYDAGKLVNAQADTNYLVYGATMSGGTTYKIYVSRMDAEGRVPTPGTGSPYVVELNPGGWPAAIALNDIDNDGHNDIVFSDYRNGKIKIFWNDGTVDGNDMPQFSTMNTYNLAGSDNRAHTFKITNLDPSKPLRKDIVVTTNWSFATNFPTSGLPDPDASTQKVGVLISQCEVANCASRSTIYTSGGTVGLAPANLPSSGKLRYATNIDVGSFRSGDNCRDIVVDGRSSASGNRSYIVVFEQNTSGSTCLGTFSTTTTWKELSTANNIYPAGLAVADYDNDGIDDIATVLGGQSRAEIFFMGDGVVFPTNSIKPLLTLPGTKIAPYCLDGAQTCAYPSLVVIGNRPPSFIGNGSALGTNYAVSSLNGTNYYHGYIAFLPNSGSGSYFEDGSSLAKIEYTIPIGIDQDPVIRPMVGTSPTKNDILVVGSDNHAMPFILTFANNGGNTSDPLKQAVMAKSMPDEFQVSAEVGNLRTVDINNDGTPDLISHLITNSAVSVTLGPINSPLYSPAPVFTPAIQHFGASVNYYRQNTMGVADFDRDDYPDIVTVGNNGRGLGISYGNSLGELSTPVIYTAGAGDIRPNHVKVGDIDSDGILDMVVLTQSGTSAVPTVNWLRGKGDGSFHESSTLVAAGFGCNDARSIEARDLDGDGVNEIALLCYNPARIYVFRRHADGTWRAGNNQITGLVNPVAFKFAHLTPGDACAAGTEFNGKPCIDIVVSQLSVTATVHTIRNLTVGEPAGNGSFNIGLTSSATTPLYGYGAELGVADFDLDGYLDLVVTMYTQNSTASGNAYGQTYYVLRGNNNGSWLSVEGFGMEGIGGSDVSVADLDGNNQPDIVVGYRRARTPTRMIGRNYNFSN